MERDALPGIDPLTLNRGYATQGELLVDVMARLDLILYNYYSRHRWLGPSSDLKNMLGLVVSREEFEHNLTKAAQRGLREQLNAEEREQLALAEQMIALRLERTETAFPLLQLRARFQLTDFEWDCVLLAYVPVADRKYTKLMAYLQDDMTRKAPGTALACELFLPEGEELETYLAAFHRQGGFLRLFDEEALAQDALVLKAEVVEFLSTGFVTDREGRTLYDGAARRPSHPLRIQTEMARRLDRALDAEGVEKRCVLLSGPPGSGKRFQLEHLMSRCRAACVFADLAEGDWLFSAQTAALVADLTGAYLCLYHLDRKDETGKFVPPPPAMLEALERLELARPTRFFLSERPAPARLGSLTVELELPPISEGERIVLFRSFLGDTPLAGFTVEELAAKFRFSPRQIRTACVQATGLSRLDGEAAVSVELMHRCCYRQAVHTLGDLASFVPAGNRWEDVVLPAAQKRLMRTACSHVRWQHRVYADWGFGEKIHYGRGLSILFAGAPGTGKTMCAQVIAGELSMEMYKINLSQIVSKYIGETEKNLRAVFTEAKNANCILFFDECDALFGKRSEVKDAHDRNANVEVAYLLQQIEEYDGVCILATNLIGNIDEAFMRRMTYVVHFPFPDAAARERIFRGLVPSETPLSEDVNWSFLAEKFEISGGHIKNIVLSAAFMAAGEGEDTRLGMKHLLRAAVNEMKKSGIVVVREQLREYADLLEDGNGASMEMTI